MCKWCGLFAVVAHCRGFLGKGLIIHEKPWFISTRRMSARQYHGMVSWRFLDGFTSTCSP
jgi:hypothetical protein